MTITIRETETKSDLASAEPGPTLAKYEGNWYFDPSEVDVDVLVLTARTYTCPYKGVCHWVDFASLDGGTTARDVAWIYADPKPGHELIKGRYGFYAGSHGSTLEVH